MRAQHVQEWTVTLLGRYSDSYANNQFRALQQFFRWHATEDPDEPRSNPMTGTDRATRWSTAAAVIGVAVVAAVVSYEHAYALVHAHGETGWTAHLIPLTVDGLIWASSMVMLDSAQHWVATQHGVHATEAERLVPQRRGQQHPDDEILHENSPILVR
jgi:hypothetical protein